MLSIISVTPCPSAEKLTDLLRGQLPSAEWDQVSSHVDQCEQCQAAIEHVSLTHDDVVASCKQQKARFAYPEIQEPECLHAVLDSVKEVRDSKQALIESQSVGPYQLIRPLGVGGMGTVYLARHNRLQKLVAIKLLSRTQGDSVAGRNRFDREMAAIAAVEHSHIVQATDAGEADGWHYLVMEYLDGLDLSRISKRLGRLPIADAVAIVCAAASGLQQIHSLGWVHRDVKPSNIMLTRQGTVKLLDLGLVLGHPENVMPPNDDRLTTVGHLMGTVAFMAPEQLVDSGSVDARADIYALAATLFRLLTGEDPHLSRSSLPATILAKTTEPARSLEDLCPSAPAELIDMVDRSLRLDLNQRPATIAEFIYQLEPLAKSADLSALIKRALRSQPVNEERDLVQPLSSTSVRDVQSTEQSVATSSVSGKRSRGLRNFLWIAIALPWFLFAAGVIVVIQTDRGELVIESPRDDLQLNVSKDGEFVEKLTLNSGENRTILRSGSYTITLDASGDGWQLDDNKITITRGGEAVVSVTQRPSTVASASANQPVYMGKTFTEWNNLLLNERSTDSILQATDALPRLATTAEERRTAARSLLLATRHLGGITSANPAPIINSNSYGFGQPTGSDAEQSNYFMHVFNQSFPRLMPDPGLELIVDELKQKNSRSTLACIFVLQTYVGNSFEGYPLMTRDRFESLLKDAEGKTLLEKLDQALKIAASTLGGMEQVYSQSIPVVGAGNDGMERYGVTLVIGLRAKIFRMLDKKLASDAELLRYALTAAEKSGSLLPQTQNTTWLPSLTYDLALMLLQEQPETINDAALVDCMTSWIVRDPATASTASAIGGQNTPLTETLHTVFRTRLQQHPDQLVEAVFRVAQQRLASGDMASFGGGMPTHLHWSTFRPEWEWIFAELKAANIQLTEAQRQTLKSINEQSNQPFDWN